MSSNFGKIIQKFLDEDIGEQLRLEEMQRRYDKSGKLYNSDILYLEKLTEREDVPIVFGEEPFVFTKETKTKAVKEIVHTVENTAKLAIEQTIEQTSKLTIKRTIPVKLIILSSIIIVSVLSFLALYFNLYFLPDILIYNELYDLIFTNIILPMCDVELYLNPCHILD